MIEADAALELTRGGSTPDKLDWRFDVGVNAPLHRAGVRCVFKALLNVRGGCAGNLDCGRQPDDSPWGSAAHFFVDGCRGPAEVEVQISGNNAHRRQHARAE